MTTRLLSAEDIFDVYGLEWVLQAKNLDQTDQQIISFRLGEIKEAYVNAAKSRIRAEARFLGLDVDDLSLTAILHRVKERLTAAVRDGMMSNAEQMMRGGSFNLFGEILKAHSAAGKLPEGIDPARYGVKVEQAPSRPEVDPNWFMKGNSGRMTEDPRWAEITQAYLAVEAATGDHQIITAIDRLNQLQHNSFHVLIDLQTGRMLDDHENASDHQQARQRLQEILEIKLHARQPTSFAEFMSREVRGLLTKYRAATPFVT